MAPPEILYGQPKDFNIEMVIPSEPANRDVPANVVDAGDPITLRSYLHVDATVTPILKKAVSDALTSAAAKLVYHLHDLETGNMVPTIAGGALTKLTPAQVALDGNIIDKTGDWYLSQDTAITTGPGNTLQVPAGEDSGTWRVTTVVSGGPGSFVSAFHDWLFIEVDA